MNAQLIESSAHLVERPMSVIERASKALSKAEVEAEIKALVEQSKSIVAVTDSASREVCHQSLMVLRNMRIQTQKASKEGRDEAVQYSKAVIKIENELVALLTPEETRLAKIRDDWDAIKELEKQARIDAEIARVAALQERIAELRGCQILTPASGSALILEHIADLEKIPVDETFEEFEQQAADAKTAAIFRLNSIHAAAIVHEAEQAQVIAERAELAKLRAEAADRDRLAKEAQAKADADAQAERDRLEALSKAERAAETARQAEANRLERDRIAKEEAEQTAARERNEMAMQEIQAIHHQMIIADTGRAPYCKGGDVETLDWLIPQTEKWEITETKFGALTAMAQKTKESVLIGLRQKRVDLVQRIEDERAAEFDRQHLVDQRTENARIAAESKAALDRQAEAQRVANAAETARLAEQQAEIDRQQAALAEAQKPKPAPLEIFENKVTGETLSVAAIESPAIVTREQMLEGLLIDARYYVEIFDPIEADEISEQERLLHQIDEALPLSATPEVCAAPHCCLPAAHEGPCDDIPW